MHKAQRCRAHSRSEDRELLELVHQITPDHDLDSERKLRHVATRERAHEAIERSITAPAIVIFTRHAVQTKRNMRNSRAIGLKRRPDTLEVPAIRDEARSQTSVAD